jgi:hypothetical protein
MVTKNKTGEKRGKVKVGKLKLNKETVKDLSAEEQKKVKGGLGTLTCSTVCFCSLNCTKACTENCPRLP